MSVQKIDNYCVKKYPMTFRNDCGAYKTPGGAWIRYGLFPGSGDRIGWQTVTVTPDMVGKEIAVFLSVEMKTENDRLSHRQKVWNGIVKNSGGIVRILKETSTGNIIDEEYTQ